MTEQYKYYAFISYKREDERWAKWLQHKLEYYRIPMAVRRQNPNLPERVRPIFKDTTDLSGGVLEKAINEALEQSQYLIIICSPRAAKSPWVCKEVQRFIDLGKEENIIPFIVDGTPFSNDATECFPAALKSLSGERELLGININENGQDSAAVKVVARMFNTSFDVLWQRFRRSESRRRKMIATITTAFIIMLLGIVVYIWQKNVELQTKNKTIAQQSDLIKAASDSILLQQKQLESTNDSLFKTNDALQKAYNDLEISNNTLSQKNRELAEANDVILRERWSMLSAQSKAVAEKVQKLTVKGDYSTAQLLALEVLPKQIDTPNRPYTFEAEAALRTSCIKHSAVLSGHESSIRDLSISPDGRFLASASSDNTLRVWDCELAREVWINDNLLNDTLFHFTPMSVEYSKCGKFLIVSAGFDCVLLDANSGRMTKKFAGDNKDGFAHNASISNDKEMIAVTYEHKVQIWNSNKEELIRTMTSSKFNFTQSEFSPDCSKLMTVCSDGMVRIWDIETGRQLLTISDENNYLGDASFSPDGKLVATISGHNMNSGSDLVVWNASNADFVQRATFKGSIYGLQFTPNGKSIFTLCMNNVCAVSIETGFIDILLQGEKSNPGSGFLMNRLAMSAYGNNITAGSMNGDIYLWNISGEKEYEWVRKTNVKQKAIAYSPDGHSFAVGGEDGTILIADASNGEVLRQMKNDSQPIVSLNYSPDGNRLVAVSQKGTTLWNASQGTLIKHIDTWCDWNAHDIFTTNDELVCVAVKIGDNNISLYDVDRGSCNGIIVTSLSLIKAITTSPDKQLIFVAETTGGRFNIFDKRSGGIVCKQNLGVDIKDAVFSPDNKHVAVALSSGTIYIIEAITGEVEKKLIGHKSRINHISYNPDGKHIVSAAMDRTVRFWNVELEAEVFSINRFDSWVNSVEFSPDGRAVITADESGMVHRFKFLPLQQLIDETRARFKNRKLTPEERSKYYLE